MTSRLAWIAAWLGLVGCAIEYRVPAEDSGTTDAVVSDTGTAADGMCGDALDTCNGTCVDILTDPQHCGGCGSPCAATEVCDAGTCSSTCTTGLSVCDQSCVDLTSDPLHCGVCTEQCDAGVSCVGGECAYGCNDACDRATEVCVAEQCECRSGFERCGDTCVDPLRNPLHCGQCDRDCGGDPCGDGECQPAGCAGFPDQCGDSCTDFTSDPLNCRECDRTCDGDEICVNAKCEHVD